MIDFIDASKQSTLWNYTPIKVADERHVWQISEIVIPDSARRQESPIRAEEVFGNSFASDD